MNLPLTGKTFTQAKLWSEAQRLDQGIALDDAANSVDAQQLIAAEGAAKIARQGKLRDEVYALSLTSSAQTVPVWIWADFRDNDHSTVRREQILADSNLRAQHMAQRSAKLQAVTSKVTAWLDARAFATYERGTTSPAISADIPASALGELGRLDGVAVVDLRTEGRPDSTAWFADTKANLAQTIVGSAASQIFCNSEGFRPDDYTYLSFSPPTQHYVYPTTLTPNLHTRWTTELIAATAGNRAAPGATAYIANWDTQPSYSAWHWCFVGGIENLNRSYSFNPLTPGGLSVTDMAQDYYVYQWPYPTITLSAGNCGTTCTGGCASGMRTVLNRSYNALVVGGANDKATTSPSDDQMATFSPYDNPTTTHNDFELPNLVAPAVNVDSASTTDCGTSASAPQVLGAALLMKERNSQYLGWPEMTRATILATATRGIDTSGRTVNLVGGGGQKQGAGLLNTYNAVVLADSAYHVVPNSTAVSRGHDVQGYDFATMFPGGIATYVYNISATKTGRLRVVIAWDASASGCNSSDGSGCTADLPDGDIDLFVYQKSGSSWLLRCASNTYDGTWELCDSSVTAGQTYKAELHLRSANATSTFLGIAWWNYDPSTDE